MIAKKLQDSPHTIAKFNQHAVLSDVFPEHQPKGGFPNDMNIFIDSDVINDDDDDKTAGLSSDERLPNNHSITNDASVVQPDIDLTMNCNSNKRQRPSSEGDASAVQPDADSTTACNRDRRQRLSSEGDASVLKAGRDCSVSNREGSIELEVRYRY